MPLTAEQRAYFVEHGWLKIENAIRPEIIDAWLADFWIRLGFDPDDKSAWVNEDGSPCEFLKMPRHREMLCSEMAPEAWEAMVEIVGGEDRIDPIRERHHGDQFIVNFGSERLSREEAPADNTRGGWHNDMDWQRMFLDTSGNALTIIHCFSDIPEGGGGTVLCEDGLAEWCNVLLRHPEGFDPPYTIGEGYPVDLFEGIRRCKNFARIVAKKGDTYITHGLLPHTVGTNQLHYARIITNPHVNLIEPWNLNRPDGDYTLCEQAILNALERDSLPEWKPTRERKRYFPRTATFKVARAQGELVRMLKHAEATGGMVDSVYLQGEEALRLHRQRNGYDQEHGPGRVAHTSRD